MIQKLSPIEKMLVLSIAFTMLLLAFRIMYTQELTYIFYVWNTILAIVPLWFSRKLVRQSSINRNAIILLVCWLLFFPNAPYIITDIFHYEERVPIPKWYDLLIVISAAWNGLLLGIVSLMQVETFLSLHLKKQWVTLSIFASLLLCGYGVFIGRFLRFNSWDILTKPQNILFSSAHQLLHPNQNRNVWLFTFLFASMLSLVYFTLRHLPKTNKQAM
jgi:uncharacterized membrane protein